MARFVVPPAAVIDFCAPVCEMPRTRRSTVEPRLTFAVVTAVCCESLSFTSVSIALAAFERAARLSQDAQARGSRLLAAMDAATGRGISGAEPGRVTCPRSGVSWLHPSWCATIHTGPSGAGQRLWLGVR